MRELTIVDFEIVNRLLAAIADEMGIVLRRAALSPNIKERRDFSCAIFHGDGSLLAQAAHIPVHLGAMPLTLQAVRSRLTLRPGDCVITNDPFSGGTHLPDITLIKGVFLQGGRSPAFYLVCRAHHADVGGEVPGSMALTRSIHQEGVLIPPSLLVEGGRPRKGFLEGLVSRMRNPQERRGDLEAQAAALERGEARLLELVERWGMERLEAAFQGLLGYGRRVMAHLLREIPAGTYRFADALDDNGITSDPVPIEVEMRVEEGRVRLDFSRSAPQQPTGVNGVRAVTHSAVYSVLPACWAATTPTTAGSWSP